MANDFSCDPDIVALYNFESGALVTDSISTNTLTGLNPFTGFYHGPIASATSKQGSDSADFESSSGQWFFREENSLSSDFPFKCNTSNVNFGVTCWFQPESSDQNQIIVHKCLHGEYPYDNPGFVTDPPTINLPWQFAIQYTGTQQIALLIGNSDGSFYTAYVHPSVLTNTQWYHIGVTYRHSDGYYRIRIWDDNAGAMIGADKTGFTVNLIPGPSWCSAIAAGGGSIESNGNFYVGSFNSTGQYLDGLLDELVIFSGEYGTTDGVLTPAKIDAIRAGTWAPFCTTTAPTTTATTLAPTTYATYLTTPLPTNPPTDPPTTAGPTTAGPTTVAPTTPAPTTLPPTTLAPTTAAPTTAAPTTLATTLAPTTTLTTPAPTTGPAWTLPPTTASPYTCITDAPTTSCHTQGPVTIATTTAPYTWAFGWLGEFSTPEPTTTPPTTVAPTTLATTAAP